MKKSVMQHQFSMIPKVEVPRSVFNRSHTYKTTFDSGYLVPFYVDEALPGDTFKLEATLFARLATPVVPIMDNLYLDTFFFAVPLRLIWDNFQKFMGERENPEDSIDYLVPQIQSGAHGFAEGSLEDYFGLPINVPNLSVSALWHRAYNLIWNEWFRDQNLQDQVPVPKGDGPDHKDNYKLLKRGKRHDYFTSCLPWPQKGPGIELPIGGTANVYTNGSVTYPVRSTGLALRFTDDGYDVYGTAYDNGCIKLYKEAAYTEHFRGTSVDYLKQKYGDLTEPGNKTLGIISPASGSGMEVHVPYHTGLYADLGAATAFTINSLRQAFQIQKLLERDARGGTRYIELIRSHFGVISPDARLQRPEYLGGATKRVTINPVQQTSATTETSPLGNLAAFGYVADSGHGFTRSFTEHCVIIGLLCVRADLTYQQGIPRMFSRQTRYDFYWPTLAHLGEQAVLNKEIYARGTNKDEEVFGYQERWAEYRYYPSRITGKFRSCLQDSLDVWHLSQYFTNLPKLNSEFIEENPPLERVIAVTNQPEFLLDSYIELKCARPMPVYSVPGLIDHF